MSRPTNATINLSALQRNLRKLTMISAGSKVVAVVKADAYGNGALAVAKAIENNVDMLAVAFVDEAIALKHAGIHKPILILQGAHKVDDFSASLSQDLIWLMHTKWQLDAYRAFCLASKVTPKTWIKFDTGMHRLGFPIHDFSAVIEDYSDLINQDTAIMTHIARSDEPNQQFANEQIDAFMQAVNNTQFPLCIANSATSIRFSRARQDYVRLGIAIYGSTPFEAHDNPIELETVMRVNSQIISLRNIPKGDTVGYGGTWRAVKDSLIATVAIGYADGYPRHAPTGTPAWCNNAIVPLVGRVSMDMLTFDVTHLTDVKIGDTIQLWGDKLSINEVADHIGTISYELMTRLSSRVPRQYIYESESNGELVK